MTEVYSKLEGFPGKDDQPEYYIVLAHCRHWRRLLELALLANNGRLATKR